MSTLPLRQKLVAIALRDEGQKEVTRNRAPWIQKLWPATSYPEGYANREPYCAAGVSYVVREWLKDPEVLAALKMTPAKAEAWRCKSAAAYGWHDWAKKKGVRILSDSQKEELHTGDIVVFDFSHIGIVYDDKGNRIHTLEFNTGPSGGRDGDGCYKKDRPREIARCFIRLLE